MMAKNPVIEACGRDWCVQNSVVVAKKIKKTAATPNGKKKRITRREFPHGQLLAKSLQMPPRLLAIPNFLCIPLFFESSHQSSQFLLQTPPL